MTSDTQRLIDKATEYKLRGKELDAKYWTAVLVEKLIAQ